MKDFNKGEKRMEKPRYYIQDLNNYTSEFLIEIILWQNQELRKLAKDNSHENSHQGDSKKPVNKVATPKSEIGLDISDDTNTNFQNGVSKK